MKWILSGLIAIVSACTTTGNTLAPVVSSTGYVAKHVAGECVKISDDSELFQKSDGTPMLLIWSDPFSDSLGRTAYLLRMIHADVGIPTFHLIETTLLDDNYVTIECPEFPTKAKQL